MSEAAPQPVTFDVNVLVSAVGGGPHAFWARPSPPPLAGNMAANCLGILNDAREFSLWLSEHVVANVLRVLANLDWEQEKAAQYVRVLDNIARRSGGGVVEPHVRVNDCTDYEDNRILELAFASGSVLIVSSDADLLEMSPWRGIPILRPSEFAARMDAMRRALRRR
jgi:predicted nucleic acid-binding protein